MVIIDIKETAYYDIPELVKLFGVGKRAIYAWIQKGELETFLVGRKYYVRGSSLKAFMEQKKLPLLAQK